LTSIARDHASNTHRRLCDDLSYRLNVIRIALPPLREHLEDVEELAVALLEDLSRKYGCAGKVLDAAALDLLRRHSWPGNVCELRNTLERALVTCTGSLITSGDIMPVLQLSREMALPDTHADQPISLEVGVSLAEAERRMILHTLSLTNYNKTRAAEILGITTKTLSNKLKEYASVPAADPAGNVPS
jgi:DNA-binding NtrC family response regulator